MHWFSVCVFCSKWIKYNKSTQIKPSQHISSQPNKNNEAANTQNHSSWKHTSAWHKLAAFSLLAPHCWHKLAQAMEFISLCRKEAGVRLVGQFQMRYFLFAKLDIYIYIYINMRIYIYIIIYRSYLSLYMCMCGPCSMYTYIYIPKARALPHKDSVSYKRICIWQFTPLKHNLFDDRTLI